MKLLLGEPEIASACANFAARLGYDVDWDAKVRIQVDNKNNWTATVIIKDKYK